MYSVADIYGNSKMKTTQEMTVPNELEQEKVSAEAVKPERHQAHGNIIFWLVTILAVVVFYHLGARA
jgi:hypothetical protein